MIKRITIYLCCAVLILVGAHVYAQQIDSTIDLHLIIGGPMSLTISEEVADWGILAFPHDNTWHTELLGEYGRTLHCNSGYGSAVIEIVISPMLVDLTGNNPDMETPADFKLSILDDPTNNPVDLFASLNTIFDAGIPVSTIPFSDAQDATWSLSFLNNGGMAKGEWQGTLTFSLIAQ